MSAYNYLIALHLVQNVNLSMSIKVCGELRIKTHLAYCYVILCFKFGPQKFEM